MQRFGYSLFAFCLGVLSTAASGCGSNQGCEEFATAYCTKQVGCLELLVDGVCLQLRGLPQRAQPALPAG